MEVEFKNFYRSNLDHTLGIDMIPKPIDLLRKFTTHFAQFYKFTLKVSEVDSTSLKSDPNINGDLTADHKANIVL